MEERVGFSFITNLKELINFYDEKLSGRNFIRLSKIITFEAYSALLTLLSGIAFLFIALITSNDLLSILALILLSISLCLMYSIFRSRKKTVEHFFNDDDKRHYLTLANKKLSKFDDDILVAYKVDQMAVKLKDMNIHNQEYILNMIGHLESQSQNSKSKKWVPYGIIGLFMFAFWTEFVGKYLSLSTVGFLFLLGFLLSSVVVFLNNGIKTYIFSDDEKLQEIAAILKIILTSRQL